MNCVSKVEREVCEELEVMYVHVVLLEALTRRYMEVT